MMRQKLVLIIIPFLSILTLLLTLAHQRSWHTRALQMTGLAKPRDTSWLIATMSPAPKIGRRAMIRSTWQRLYHDVPMTTRFVLAEPGPDWEELVRVENDTYGDIIVLRGLEETKRNAIFVKTVVFLEWLVQRGERWSLVTKMDDDTFASVRSLRQKYVDPLLDPDNVDANRTIVGRQRRAKVKSHDNKEVEYPQGGFYTLPWNIVTKLVSLQSEYRLLETDEDVLVGDLLLRGDVAWNFTRLREPTFFDWSADDARNGSTCWAREGSNQNSWSHAVGRKAMLVHELKEDAEYMKVASCFDERGVKLLSDLDDE